MTRQGQLALAVLGALCIAAAAVEPTFLADNLSRGKSGAKTPVKAKASSYYGYADTEIACLNQQNFKSCRYTGCATELCGAGGASCGPTNVFVQTDFTCCPKDHKYGYGSHENIGVLGFTDKVGTCDWEISIYRWLSVCDVPVPVTTDDGTAIKLGTAWGTCYLNAEAENCDSPLCDRMAISIQGGLYISKAYGDSATPTTIANVEETCAGEDPDITLPDRRLQPGVAANSTKASSPSDGARASSPVQEVLQIILDLGSAALGCTTPDRKVAPAAASVANAEHEEPQLYEGCAIIISGPFYETSKHDNKIEETGMFEFTPYFSGGTPVSEPTAQIPIVTGKTAKIRFTREHESYGYEGGEGGHERR